MSEPRDQNRPETGSDAHRATSDLEARIARARGQRAAEAATEQTRQGDMSGMSRGLRLGSEFVAAIFVGAGLGYIIDMIAATSGPRAALTAEASTVPSSRAGIGLTV